MNWHELAINDGFHVTTVIAVITVILILFEFCPMGLATLLNIWLLAATRFCQMIGSLQAAIKEIELKHKSAQSAVREELNVLKVGRRG